jgi:hypothetical protein
MKKLYLLWDGPIKNQTKVTLRVSKHPRKCQKNRQDTQKRVFRMVLVL